MQQLSHPLHGLKWYCMLKTNMYELIDPKGPSNINALLIKHGGDFYFRAVTQPVTSAAMAINEFGKKDIL